jgi:hypothetical protein
MVIHLHQFSLRSGKDRIEKTGVTHSQEQRLHGHRGIGEVNIGFIILPSSKQDVWNVEKNGNKIVLYLTREMKECTRSVPSERKQADDILEMHLVGQSAP